MTIGEELTSRFFGPLLVDWLPDETLFSLCSRQHFSSGAIYGSQTCRDLFDHPYIGSRVDFPSRLNFFDERSAGKLGPIESIINHHTLLPFYLHWKNPDLIRRSLENATSIKKHSMTSNKFILGLTLSKFRSTHPLKACFECVKKDQSQYQTPYWHLTHQIPGVWICPIHNCFLMEENTPPSRSTQPQWRLPVVLDLINCTPNRKLIHDCKFLAEARKFTDACIQSFRLNSVLHPKQVTQIFWQRLNELSYRNNRRLKLQIAGDSYYKTLKPLLNIPELLPLATSEASAASSLARLFRSRLSSAHPLRYLSIIYWLFSSWDDFSETLQTSILDGKAIIEPPPTFARQNIVKEPPFTREELVTLLAKKYRNCREIACTLHVSLEALFRHAALYNVELPKRPKKLTPYIRSAILGALKEGIDIAIVAKSYDISKKTLRLLLCKEPLILKLHKENSHKHQLNLRRNQWTKLRELNPELKIRILRKNDNSTYVWLCQHDKIWLGDINS